MTTKLFEEEWCRYGGGLDDEQISELFKKAKMWVVEQKSQGFIIENLKIEIGADKND